MTKKYIVPLLKARRNYDVAVILSKHELLEKLVIDFFYSTKRYPLLDLSDRILPKKVSAKYQKYVPQIPEEKIISDWLTGIQFELRMKLNRGGDYYKHQIAAYKKLQRTCVDYIKKKNRNANVYGLDTASVELFTWMRKNSSESKLVLEQCVASRNRQIEMYKIFKEKFNYSFADNMIEHCKILREREMKEWQLSDKIICPSNYVRENIIDAGINPDKLVLIPYATSNKLDKETAKKNLDYKFQKKATKRILFVGNAALRKGINEIFYIAKKFITHKDIQFFVAGSIDKVVFKQYQIPRNIIFLGYLNQRELNEQYKQADLFLFPSYLEGSALVIYEALQWGIPVVTTHESGSTVSHAKDGYVASAGECEKLTKYTEQLLFDDDLRYEFAKNALKGSEDFSIEIYSKRLIHCLST